MPRDAGDIEKHAEDLGEDFRKEMNDDGEAGADKNVSVRAMVKAWNKMAEKGFTVSKQVTEGKVLSVKKKGGAEPGSPAKAPKPEEDDDMDLGDLEDDLDLDVDLEDEEDLDLDVDDDDDLAGDDANNNNADNAAGDDDLGDLDDMDLDDLDLGDLDGDDDNNNNNNADGDEELDLDLDDDDDAADVEMTGQAEGDQVSKDVTTNVDKMKQTAAHEDLQGAMTQEKKEDKKPELPKLNLGALPKPAEEEEKKQEEEKKDPQDSVVTLRIDSHLLMNNKFLKEPFKVVKIDEGAIVGGRKERIWEIDFFTHQFNNLDSNGYKSFSLLGSKLFRVERHISDPKRITVYFFEAAHPYDLIFTSVDRRNRFFELSMLQRRASVLWCPSLCPDGENDARIQINGTNIKRHSGKVAKVNGKGNFMIARMPYEIHEVWFGVINLRGKPLPTNPSVLLNMMPKGSEVYVLGVLEVPNELLGQKSIGEFVIGHLGSNSYYVLAQSVIESKPKSCNSNTVILTIVRRPFIIHLSNIEGVELDSVVTDASGSPTGYTMAACTLRIHESLCAFIVVQAVGTAKLSDSQRASHFRLALSNLAIGNEKLDIGSRFDYTFIGGALGFPKPYESDDALLHQMQAGNMLSDFKEANPSADLRGAQFPMRVFYKARQGSCRADVKTYSSVQKGIPFGNNTHMSVDLFTLRTFLSSFGETAKPLNLHLKDLIIVPERIPAFGDAELHITGSWFENPGPIPIVKSGEHYAVRNEDMPLLRPSGFHKEFVRLQHMDFAIFGVLDAAKEKKKNAKKVLLACGSLTLKNNSAIGEYKDVTIPLMFRACTVGSVIAQIGLPLEHVPVLEEAASPTLPRK